MPRSGCPVEGIMDLESELTVHVQVDGMPWRVPAEMITILKGEKS